MSANMEHARPCRHCGKPVSWNTYWTTWDHEDRQATLEAELCEPAKGFHGSTYAEPERKS